MDYYAEMAKTLMGGRDIKSMIDDNFRKKQAIILETPEGKELNNQFQAKKHAWLEAMYMESPAGRQDCMAFIDSVLKLYDAKQFQNYDDGKDQKIRELEQQIEQMKNGVPNAGY